MFDINNVFSNEQAVTSTAVSENVYDFGDAKIRSDLGKTIVEFAIKETFTGPTSVEFALVEDSTSALSSATTLVSSGPIATSELVAGKRIHLRLPINGIHKQYIGCKYTVTGSAATAGKVTAYLTDSVDTWDNR